MEGERKEVERKEVEHRKVREERRDAQGDSQVLDKAVRRVQWERRAEQGEGEDEDTEEREQTQGKRSNSHVDHIHNTGMEDKRKT